MRSAHVLTYHSGNITGNDYSTNDTIGHGTIAAFSSNPGVVTATSDRWKLPRNICGTDWTSPEGLAALLV